MNTKNVCKELNISPKALRIYEELEIVVPKRNENNYRNYDQDDILLLRQVMFLKEMGIPLKNIKMLLNKDFDEENKIIRGLELQLKAVNSKILELENIKYTLFQSVNEALANKEDVNYNQYFNKVTKCLKENQENRTKWIDKWEFNSWAKNYDNSVKNISKDGLKLFEKYEYVIDSVIKRMGKLKNLNILDIGCGTGNLYGKLNEEVQFTGIDQSIEMLLQAKAKYLDINVRLGNFLDEPFIKNEFDIVVSTYAFHHLNANEKENSINLLLKYLKPKGKIIIGDLMFLNESERMKQKDYFYEIGRRDLWDTIEDEYYTDIEEIKKYSEFRGCKIYYEHLVNFTWLIEITKL